jgi:hypothetical protein
MNSKLYFQIVASLKMKDEQLTTAEDARNLTIIQKDICDEKRKYKQEQRDEINYNECVKRINEHVMTGQFKTTCFAHLSRIYINQLKKVGYHAEWNADGTTHVSWYK